MMQAILGAIVTGLVAMSTITLINRQKRKGVETQLTMRSVEIQKRIQELIRNDRAWANMVANNASMACLRSTAAPNYCSGDAGGAFTLYNADSPATVFYNSSTAGAGFDSNGNVCTTYSVAGNDNCPYKVAMSWRPINPGTTTACSQSVCDAEITGTFTYSPSSQIRRLPFYQENYKVSFVRETKTRQDYLYYVQEENSGTPGGACASATGTYSRVFTHEKIDTGNNASVASFPATQITLKAGTYYCEATAPVGAVLDHQAKLVINGGTPSSIVGSSGYYFAPSTVSGRFTLSSDNWIRLDHSINRGTVGAADGSCQGRAAVIAGVKEVYAQIRCRRVSQ